MTSRRGLDEDKYSIHKASSKLEEKTLKEYSKIISEIQYMYKEFEQLEWF